MRTVTYKSVADAVMRSVGIDPAADTVTSFLKAMVADYINERVRQAWEFAWWPELMRIEERAYRRTWRATDTYASGDEVYHEGLYYEAQRSSTDVEPGTSTADWVEVDELDKYIELERLGETAIGEVKAVSEKDPRLTVAPDYLEFTIGENGIQLPYDAPATVWVEFRLQPNTYTGTAWSAEGSYSEGDLVLDDDGDVYKAILVDGNQYWLKVEFPFVLCSFVKRAAKADMLRSPGGQKDRADREEEMAWDALNKSADNVFMGQGIYQTAKVETY